MASGQTTNFGLNQWAAEDKILREEFNADNAKIEAAILAAQKYPCCVTGSYEGGVEGGVTVELGFRPSFLVIFRGATTSENNALTLVLGTSERTAFFRNNGTIGFGGITIGDNSFSTTHTPDNSYGLNYTGITYYYAAFH